MPVSNRNLSSNKKSVIYIMGDGRSGSTILSVILGNHPNILSVGEIDKWIKFKGKPKRGNPKHRDSVFWDDIFKKYTDRSWSGSFQNLQKAHRVIENYKYFPRVLTNKTPGWAQELYQDHTAKLINTISNHAKKRIITDSSKNIGRAWMLLRNPYLDTRVIHLIRGPRATMHSTMKKNIEQKYKSPIIAMLHYSLKNFCCILVIWTAPKGTAIRVRYEDIILSPRTELKRIGDFLGTDMDHLVNMIRNQKPFTIPPLLDGNRIRVKETISVRYDDSWKTKLSRSRKILALLITFPFSCVFGYLKRG